jgi:hypothetical protein
MIETTLYASHAAWQAAGRPAGGVFPVPAEDRSREPEGWPARYRDVATVYYVALPTGQLWCPWQKAYNRQQGGWYGEGWTVSGPPDKLTAQPSIAVDGYHGWLTDGVLSDPVP